MKNNLETSFIGHPKPLFSLFMVEIWERFSFYGIRPLLVLFMSALLVDGGMGLDRENASAIVGIFAGSLYLATLPGGYFADRWLGQKKAVFYGALIIAIGHLSIALSVFSHLYFFLGLIFIVIGTGLFKTCSSVMVGMLYKHEDKRRDSGFIIFYMGINIGAFIAPLICGLVQKNYGWHLGFGVGGLGMLISLLIFYFKTIPDFNEFNNKIGIDKGLEPPQNQDKTPMIIACVMACLTIIIIALFASGVIAIRATVLAKNMVFIITCCVGIYFLILLFFSQLQKSERKNMFVFIILLCAAAIFWSAFEQKPTTFNLFANDYTDRIIFGWEIPTTWFQSLNALFIIIFAPIASYIWLMLAKKDLEISSIAKFGIGVGLAGVGFGIMMLASMLVVENNTTVAPSWIILSILFLTLGELCLSPVGLSLMTKIAPKLIQNQVMGLWFTASALGNIVAGIIGGGVRADNINALPNLFANCMWILFAVALLLFIIRKPIHKLLQH